MKRVLFLSLACMTLTATATTPVNDKPLKDSPSATAQVRHTNAYHGSTMTIYSYHSVHLVNNTDVGEEITYTFSLCVNGGKCEMLTAKKYLQPAETFDDSGSVAKNAKFDYAGDYIAQARTEVFSNPHVDVSNFDTIHVY
jgi:hypothetical protein